MTGDETLMQGFCLEAPNGDIASEIEELDIGPVRKEPWQAPRCVLLSSETLFVVDSSRVWLDSLHVQMLDGSMDVIQSAFRTRRAGHMYVTNCVAQGERGTAAVAVDTEFCVGGVYVQGMYVTTVSPSPH